jgi:hypothetical protein
MIEGDAKTALMETLKRAVMETARVAGIVAADALMDPTWARRTTEIREVTKHLRRAVTLADMVE